MHCITEDAMATISTFHVCDISNVSHGVIVGNIAETSTTTVDSKSKVSNLVGEDNRQIIFPNLIASSY